MFTELPKLFDRNFGIGYLLPAAAFVAVTLGFNAAYQLFPRRRPEGQSIWQDASLLGTLSWLVGVALMTINTPIIRVMEGYCLFNEGHWPLNLDQRLNWLERHRFKHLNREIEPLNAIPLETIQDEQWNKLSGLK